MMTNPVRVWLCENMTYVRHLRGSPLRTIDVVKSTKWCAVGAPSAPTGCSFWMPWQLSDRSKWAPWIDSEDSSWPHIPPPQWNSNLAICYNHQLIINCWNYKWTVLWRFYDVLCPSLIDLAGYDIRTFTGEDGSTNASCSCRVSSKGAIRSGRAPCWAANLGSIRVYRSIAAESSRPSKMKQNEAATRSNGLRLLRLLRLGPNQVLGSAITREVCKLFARLTSVKNTFDALHPITVPAKKFTRLPRR